MQAPAHGRLPILSIVLAGGEGKRLLPLTADRAKPAVPFGGKYRLIDFAISNLVNGGFRHLVVLTQYKSHSLDVHISLTWQLSTILGNYVTTVPAQMRRGPRWYTGSADALFQNMNLLDDERPDHVIVFGADHIYRMDPRQMLNAHIESGAGVTVAAVRVPASESYQFGTIEKAHDNEKILGFHEKKVDAPTIPGNSNQVLASMGNYIFEVEAFREAITSDSNDSSSRHDIGGDIIPKMASTGDAYTYDYTTNIIPGESGSESHYWRDVGTLDSYYDAHMDLVAPLPNFSLYNDQWPIFTRGLTEPPAKISDGAHGPSHMSNCVMSNGVIVSGATCNESVLSRGAKVLDQATVSNAVLMDNVVVSEGAKVRNCVIDKNVVVPPGFEVGFNAELDAQRFTVTDNGVVAIPKNYDLTQLL